MLLARHTVVQASLASNETDYNKPFKRMQREMVTSRTMKEFPVLCGMQPMFDFQEPEDIPSGVEMNVFVMSMIQSRLLEQIACSRYVQLTFCWIRLEC